MASDRHIRNPVEWVTDQFAGMVRKADSPFRVLRLPEEEAEIPAVRTIGFDDIRGALAQGYDDLAAFRTDALSLAVIYPVIGLVLAFAAVNYNLLPLVFPLASGFALIGPIAGLGLYALSRQREQDAANERDVASAPAYGAIALVGFLLLAIFVAWLLVAYWIYSATLGPEPPESIGAFIRAVFTTGAGWTMIVAGVGTGFLFAVVVLAIGVVSFPLMLDRPVGPVTAIRTSVSAVVRNPIPMAAWGVIVAAGLVIGSVPALLGLVVVMPLLGHATWHLYRRLVPPLARNSRLDRARDLAAAPSSDEYG
jgi:uncharacterized membrane protein